MDAIVKHQQQTADQAGKKVENQADDHTKDRPSREDAEAAVRTLIKWAGDDPTREGLIDTPRRVAKAFGEYFSGYGADPAGVLSRTFEEVESYDDIVIVRDIDVTSHCEHHMVPVIGRAHVAYLPDGKVVGLSKLARLVDIYARRLQTQETMTAQIADALESVLKPKGVAIMVDAVHHCMTMRGVKNKCASTITTQFRGAFRDDARLEQRFLASINASK